MTNLPEFDELHVVSDLHLGGETPSRQLFNQGKTFTRLMDLLLKRPPGTKQALVINGDLVDFLAEPYPLYFDPVGAVQKLDRILRDPSFTPVWDGLRRFVKVPDRQLILTLGNHDLELALPLVRSYLLQELTRGDDDAISRITLAFDENGYSCRVGKAKILCVHGNEVDPWNVTDWARLRQICQDVSQGVTWTPNGGSKLVIDVMNGIKADFPFVDLLKPETAAVLPTLAILKPSLLPRIGSAAPSWFRSRRDQSRMNRGLLGEEDGHPLPGRQEPPALLGEMLGEALGDAAFQGHGVHDLDYLLRETEQRFRQGVTPLSLAGGVEQTRYLGVIGAIWNAVSRKGASEVLREALEGLRKDRNFCLQLADETYLALDRKTAADVDFLVAGHTHLERALPLRGTSRFYYNSGTWARLMQLPAEMLGDADRFRPVYTALIGKQMDILDQARWIDAQGKARELVLLRPAVVSFEVQKRRTFGELRHVSGSDLVPVPASRFPRG